ncbi:MAG: hypothetical protein L0207_05510 [Chlamydiae bacterium]|nr:hypothetical protein [Chlamydiota bacterium]
MEYQRQVKIDVSLQKVHFFMREIKNLPIWTRFFKRCISYNKNIGEMETVLGRSLTTIQEEQSGSFIKLLISSKFDHRQEQAVVTIEGNKQQTNVIFHLKIPPEFSEEQQQKMVTSLEEELRTLKKHLESNYG